MPSSSPIQPVVAFQALRRLVRDPEQTQEVFTIIRALSGNSLEHAFVRFRNTPVGHKVLLEQRDILDTLKDRTYLASLPANSLGRAYLRFVTEGNLTADGLVDASADDEAADIDADRLRFNNRQRDTHDLWHTLTQYGRDELGEACLLAFTYAQNRNRGLGVICLVGCAKLAQHYGRGVFGAAWRAYQDGKRAAWLPAQDWEHLLTQPVDAVRQSLLLQAPDNYRSLRGEFATA